MDAHELVMKLIRRHQANVRHGEPVSATLGIVLKEWSGANISSARTDGDTLIIATYTQRDVDALLKAFSQHHGVEYKFQSESHQVLLKIEIPTA